MLKILKNDEYIKDIGRLNEFTGDFEVFKTPPWRKQTDNNKLWTEYDEAQLRNYLSINYGIENQNRLQDVLVQIFYQSSYHPIKEYLSKLQWDGKQRLESVFIDYLGAEDNKYARTVTRKILVAAVARIFEPGKKFDYALILVGKQSINKSFLLRKLGKDWFNESINTFNGDEALMKLRGSWICELAELTAFSNSDLEQTKAFISAQVDIYRPKYEKFVKRFPRQCVFFGTTNNMEFLKDPTGSRRFWPLLVKIENQKKDPHTEFTDEIVDQIWAEAVQFYKNGEQLYLDDKDVEREALLLQEFHSEDNGLTGIIEEFIKTREKVCSRQIWYECLKHKKEPTAKDIRYINEILRKIGWDEYRGHFGQYGFQRGFIKSKDWKTKYQSVK